MQRIARSYLYYDYGASFFGDFAIDFEFEITGASADTAIMGQLIVSNLVGTIQEQINANAGILVYTHLSSGNINLVLNDRLTDNSDGMIFSGTTVPLRYATLTRFGSTATLKIYSDQARTALIDTLTITSQATALRYLLTTASLWVTGTQNISGCVNKIRLYSASSSSSSSSSSESSSSVSSSSSSSESTA
jgi:hypothetical protein